MTIELFTGYIEHSLHSKRKISNMISESINLPSTSTSHNFPEPPSKKAKMEATVIASYNNEENVFVNTKSTDDNSPLEKIASFTVSQTNLQIQEIPNLPTFSINKCNNVTFNVTIHKGN